MTPEQVVTKSIPTLESSPLASIDTALNRIFPSTKDESRQLKARGIMGDCVNCIADEELEAYLTQFQYLIDVWLDAYETQVFDGQTLKQLLGQA